MTPVRNIKTYHVKYLILSREPDVSFTRLVLYKYMLSNSCFLCLTSCSTNIHYCAYNWLLKPLKETSVVLKSCNFSVFWDILRDMASISTPESALPTCTHNFSDSCLTPSGSLRKCLREPHMTISWCTYEYSSISWTSTYSKNIKYLHFLQLF